MKKFVIAALFFTLSLFALAANREDCSYAGLIYCQKGVLTTGDIETPVVIFGRTFKDKYAMQMESKMGALCRIELDLKGNVIRAEQTEQMKKDKILNFILRDYLLILNHKSSYKNLDSITFLRGDKYYGIEINNNYSITFSNFRPMPASGRIVPFEIQIKDRLYSLALETLYVK